MYESVILYQDEEFIILKRRKKKRRSVVELDSDEGERAIYMISLHELLKLSVSSLLFLRHHKCSSRLSTTSPYFYLCHLYIYAVYTCITVFCPGFQKGRVPSEKGTVAR